VTSRLGAGKPLSFSYSVPVWVAVLNSGLTALEAVQQTAALHDELPGGMVLKYVPQDCRPRSLGIK
jgi:hypothetical protein